jgi:hypothetical protein
MSGKLSACHDNAQLMTNSSLATIYSRDDLGRSSHPTPSVKRMFLPADQTLYDPLKRLGTARAMPPATWKPTKEPRP